ncbi:MAG: alpha/beta fold hydrolase [Candidatus Hermodarchaeota archaeon]
MPFFQQLYFLEKGQSTDVNLLFLHGGGGNHQLWDHQVKFFERNFGVTLLDLPGHGKSAAYKPLRDIPVSVKALDKLLNQVYSERANVLIGHSYAGYVLMGLLKTPSPSLRGLVFLDCPASFDLDIIRNQVQFAQKRLKLSPKDLEKATKESFLRMMGKNLPEDEKNKILAALAQVDLNWYYSIMAKREEMIPPLQMKSRCFVNIPILIIEAQYGGSGHPDQSYRKIFDKFSYHVIPKTHHFCFLEKPEIVNSCILEFIDEINI